MSRVEPPAGSEDVCCPGERQLPPSPFKHPPPTTLILPLPPPPPPSTVQPPTPRPTPRLHSTATCREMDSLASPSNPHSKLAHPLCIVHINATLPRIGLPRQPTTVPSLPSLPPSMPTPPPLSSTPPSPPSHPTGTAAAAAAVATTAAPYPTPYLGLHFSRLFSNEPSECDGDLSPIRLSLFISLVRFFHGPPIDFEEKKIRWKRFEKYHRVSFFFSF